MKSKLFYLLLAKNSSANKTELETGNFPYAFKSNGHRLRNYRIYGAEGGVGDEITDENDDNYEKYAIPVVIEGKNIMQSTGNPSTIRGVKWEYRSDGAVTGTRTSANENVSDFTYFNNVTIPAGSYIFSYADAESTPTGSTYQASITINGQNRWGTTDYSFTVSEPATIRVVLRVYPAFDGTAVFKPMLRRSVVTDGTFVKYQTPVTANIYLDEPIDENEYIDFREQRCYRSDNTSEIISLPALPSIDGTNVLFVNTEVQPGKVYVQGNVEEIVTISVQSLNANLQNLAQQDWQIENENSLDVMPIDKPVLNLNNIGGGESAE